MLISVEGTGKNQLARGQESMGVTPVLSLCFVLRNTRPNPTGVLEHFSGLFLLTAFLSRRRMSVYRNYTRVTIPVNYTRDFREFLEINYVYGFWLEILNFEPGHIYTYIVTTTLCRVKL